MRHKTRSTMISRTLRASFTILLFVTAVVGSAALSASPAGAQTPTAVSTFHAIGIYWKPSGGSSTNVCKVEYRPTGASVWLEGMPLWFDNNPGTFTASYQGVIVNAPRDPARVNEYRGSIVDLTPNTQYEIRLTLQSAPGTSVTLNDATTRTMDENYEDKIATIIDLPPGTTSSSYATTQGGSPGAYVLYRTHPTTPTVIDVNNAADTCITVNHSYVIVRGATLRGARKHGIELGPVHHVVIEGCDISNWGTFKQSGGVNTVWSEEDNAGISAQTNALKDVVIQRNKIHDPRTRANSWHTNLDREVLPGGTTGTRNHPQGPVAISLLGTPGLTSDKPNKGTGGHHIIRYNEIWSGSLPELLGDGVGHQFDDGIGGDENQSLTGFPGRDSDIYGNYIANCMDDGIEAEGGGMNVRIWGNFIEYSFQGFAHAGNSMGPLYNFRNHIGFLREDPQKSSDPNTDIDNQPYPSGGSAYKIGWDNNPDFGSGRLNILHNTTLQPLFNTRRAGPENGINGGDTRHELNVYTRNNIFEVKSASSKSVYIDPDYRAAPGNDLDYDLANGLIRVGADDELNAIAGAPSYASGPLPPTVANGSRQPSSPALASGSPGFDAAQSQKNFSRFFNDGAGPDIGAVEAGKGPMAFGLTANWSTFIGSGGNSVPSITTTTLPGATVGTAYSQTLAATGGDGTLVWSLASGALPAGLSLSSGGVISGAPTAAGTSNFTVRVADSDGLTGPTDEDTQALSIVISSGVGTTVRIDTGSSTTYTDTGGKVWAADSGSNGGTTVNTVVAIGLTTDDPIYQTRRINMTGYAVNVANGTYTVRLHFAENSSTVTAAGHRVFHVTAEGASPAGWSNIDVFAEVGKNNALIKTATVTVTDGVMNLGFTATGSPSGTMIAGIEILPQ